ncbi:MAG: hypothetical protein H7X95_13625, partial [Deltaproteobacteria bacterium]|nr:hypothetical protein [Deltaproteobacteria bacterium]
MIAVGTAVAALAGCRGAAMTRPTLLDGGDKNESDADSAPQAANPQDASVEAPQPDAVTDSGTGRLATPDEYWLRRVGIGPAQTMRVCARGQGDPVAKALCGPAAQAITGLIELHRALDLPPARRGSFDLALANSSSGLSFRTVSPLNPRVFAMTDLEVLSSDRATSPPGVAVTAFSRGEQQVELAGYDGATDTLKLYLLTFTQDCNRQGGCDAQHLLGEAVEREWRSWTLYEADDLVDTPLDCVPCHQPDAHGPKRLLMRDKPDPWFHWFPSGSELSRCSTNDSLGGPDLRGVFERAHPAG